MTNLNRLGALVCSCLLAALAGTGCSQKSRQARLVRKADADFANEKYSTAEIEYRDALGFGLNPHALTQLGLVYSREGRMQQAFACLKKGEELNPHSAEDKSALAAAYVSFGDRADGMREAKETLALQPTNGQAILILSEAVSSASEIAPAEAFLHALPGQPDRFPEYHVSLATLALKSRQPAAAETELRLALQRDAKSAEAHFRLSQLYFQRTNMAQATNELKMASSLAPWRSPIRLKMADWLATFSGQAAARASLEEIVSHAPDFLPARLSMMRLDFASKQYDDCKKDIESIMVMDPNNADASLETGLLGLAQGKTSEAFSVFQKVDAMHPGIPEVKYYLGVASADQGNLSEARRYLAAAVKLNTNYIQASLLMAQLDLRSKNTSTAVQDLERLVRQQPSLLEPWLLLAEAYSIQQQPQRALRIYHDLMQSHPSDPKVPYDMGLTLLQSGDLPGANRAFAKALDLAPDSMAPLEQLINLDIKQKLYEAALQTIQARLDKNPNSSGLWLLQAGIYRAQLQNQRAEDSLNKAIALDPGLASAYVALANLYVADHKDQQALDKLNTLVSRTNDVSALMSIGMIQQQLQHYQAACDAYQKLLSVDPKFIPALNNLAYINSENLGQIDTAYLYAQKAHELRPYDPFCADTLGWVLFRRHEYARALVLAHEGADGEPGDPEVQFHLGMINYMLGDEAAARLALEKSVSSTTPFPEKDEASRHLSILAVDPQSSDTKTVEFLSQFIEHNATDPVALARLTAILERKGMFDKAADYYKAALKADPKNAAMMAQLAALYAYHLNRPGDALTLARNAHDIDGDDLVACAVLGRLTYEKGDFPYALTLLQKAANQDHPPASVLADLGLAYYAMGRTSDATGSMQKAAAKSAEGPERQAAESFLSLVHAADSPAAARAALPQAKAALQQDPHDLPAILVCAAAAQADGDNKAAQAYYDTALATFPQCAPVLRLAAILWANSLHDDDKAFALADKARPAFPRDPELARILGRVSYLRGDFAQSLQVLKEVSPDAADGEVFYYLGMDYYKLKRNSESKRALAKALALNIPSPLASEAKRALAEIK